MAYKSFSLMSLLNAIQTDAALSITSGSFDQGKTNTFNRIQSRNPLGTTLSGLGCAPVNFLSTQDISGTPNPVAHGFGLEPTAPSTVVRILVPLTPAAAALPIAHFTYNFITGVWTYVGKLTLTLNTATVHTVRSIALDDNSAGTTGWSIHVLTTNATAANGGYFYAPNIALADFTVGGGTVIASATTGDTQASKRVFWIQETGGTNNLTTGIGFAIDQATKTIYIPHLTASTVFYKFVYNTAITSVTAPGVTTELFSFKTGAYVAFGTALQTNAIKLAIPKSSQSPSLIGQKCIYIPSATAGFHFLASDLSNGSTTAPSSVTWNRVGTAVDYTALTFTQAVWSNTLDCEFAYAATSGWIMKRSINNDPNMRQFGTNDAVYSEVAGTKAPDDFSGMATVGCYEFSGVLVANSATVGQRGMYALDVAADQYFVKTYTGVVGPSFIVTPVISLDCAKAIAAAFIAEYRVGGSIPLLQFKTSGFTTWQSGWTDLPTNNNLQTVGGLTNISQVQIRILFSNIGDYNTTAQLINELILAYTDKFEVSSQWRIQLDNTSLNGNSPVTVAAKQIDAYAVKPTMYFFLYDSAKNLITTLNTSTHYAQFKKSTDGGATFSAMTGADDYTNVGGGTTVIQLNWSSPSAGIVIAAVRDAA